MFWPGVINLYEDPCHWRANLLDPPVGPTVDDLANALSSQPLRDATGPTNIEIDGYIGKEVVVSVPADIDFADCDEGYFQTWIAPMGGTRYHQGPGQVDQTIILDVDGARILIIAAYPETSAHDREDLQAIVDSIQIDVQ